jgi:ketosteroid isomerase-like protein
LPLKYGPAQWGAELRAMLTGLVSIVDHIEGETRRVTVRDDLALLSGGRRATSAGPDGQPAALTGTNAEIARRQPDGSRRFVIDDPTGGAG